MNAGYTSLNFNIPRPELEAKRQHAGAITGLIVTDDHIPLLERPGKYRDVQASAIYDIGMVEPNHDLQGH